MVGILDAVVAGFLVDPVLVADLSLCMPLAFDYLISMRYVFSHRDDMSSTHEFILFLGLSVVGLAINEAIIWIGTAPLGTTGLMVTGTKVVAAAAVMVWIYRPRVLVGWWARQKEAHHLCTGRKADV